MASAHVRVHVRKTRLIGKRLMFCSVAIVEGLAAMPAELCVGDCVDIMLEPSITTFRGEPVDIKAFARMQRISGLGWANCAVECIGVLEPQPNQHGVRVLAVRELIDVAAEPMPDPDADFEHKAGKEERHEIFARWLVETFGASELRAGGGVVDVGGGKGHIAAQLVREHAIPTTVIDPASLGPDARQLAAAPHPLLHHVRGIVTLRTCEGLAHAEGAEGGPRDDEAAAILNALRAASVIIGMHPDQATDPIVHAALALGKPFATVPCCVFPSLFPERRLRAGQGVTSTSGLCTYLVQLCTPCDNGANSLGVISVAQQTPAGAAADAAAAAAADRSRGRGFDADDGGWVVQLSRLPFVGRNRVVWRCRRRHRSPRTYGI